MSDEITTRDVYDAVARTDAKIDVVNNQVTDLRARVEVQLASGQQKMADHELRIRTVEAGKADQVDTDRRLRVLEAARWKLTGAALLAGTLSGIVAALIERKG